MHAYPQTPFHSRSMMQLRAGAAALLCSLVLMVDAYAIDTDLPNLCTIELPDANKLSPENAQESRDCYEFGAAVGELGWGWRKKLPKHVHWLNRKDAAQLCQQFTTQFGQRMESTVPGGCVFWRADACTIVSDGPIASASIGNAVRSCAP